MIDFTRARAELARRGWTAFHTPSFLDDPEPDGPEHNTGVALRIAERLGTPSERDGGRPVWPVAPTTTAPTATFSVRAGAAGFHTDAQYHAVPEDLVCLFVVRPARDGGHTLLLGLDDAFAALREQPRADAALEELSRPVWSWHRPRVFGDAEPAGPFPVLPGDGTIRWRADNLAPGLSPAADRARRIFAAALASAPGQVLLRHEPGLVVVADNRRTLHARTAFHDPDRLLLRVRLWRQA